MCRLLRSEISTIITPVQSFRIEAVARQLCDMSLEELEAVDVTTIRTIYEIDGGRIGAFLLECPVCYRRFPRNQTETMFLCDHIICQECLEGYYTSVIPQIRDPNSLKRLTCPHCSPIVPDNPDERMNFFMMLGALVSLTHSQCMMKHDVFSLFFYLIDSSIVQKSSRNDRTLR